MLWARLQFVVNPLPSQGYQEVFFPYLLDVDKGTLARAKGIVLEALIIR